MHMQYTKENGITFKIKYMKNKEKKYLQGKVDSEGFDYCFTLYSDFKDIKDDKLHELIEEYKKAKKNLADYIGLDE